MRQLKIVKQITNRDNKSLDKYLQEISGVEMINTEEEVELTKRIKEGDQKALERMVNANLRFVVSVAKQYQNQGLPLEDLINEGNVGLIKAAQRFDESRGFKFISYAVWWIRQSILQSLAEQARMVRLPLNRIGVLTKINKAAALLEQKFERKPSVNELAELLETTSEQVQDYIKISPRHISLDAPVSEEDDTSLLTLLENEDVPTPDAKLIKESLQSEVKTSLNILAEKEREIICYYYGINGYPEQTLEEISLKLDITRERVRQLREKAIKKLKGSSRIHYLKFYL